MFSDEPGQPKQVVCGAAKDQHSVHSSQASELDLTQGTGLCEASETFLHQPAIGDCIRARASSVISHGPLIAIARNKATMERRAWGIRTS
jgi:hypothetical protein